MNIIRPLIAAGAFIGATVLISVPMIDAGLQPVPNSTPIAFTPTPPSPASVASDFAGVPVHSSPRRSADAPLPEDLD